MDAPVSREMSILESMLCTNEYGCVRDFYGERRAERSQVPLINHIHEGMAIIVALNGRLPSGKSFCVNHAVSAYCLHPLFQSDEDLRVAGLKCVLRKDPAREPRAVAVMHAMEYRWRANNWLSDKVTRDMGVEDPKPSMRMNGDPEAGDIPEVRAMLIADKVQNYKDFLAHHSRTHRRAAELDVYFQAWLSHLEVTPELYLDLAAKSNLAHWDGWSGFAKE